MLHWMARLRDIDSRWLYLATLVVLIFPLIVKIPVPGAHVSTYTQGVFDAIDDCPLDKVILIDSSWTPGSTSRSRRST